MAEPPEWYVNLGLGAVCSGIFHWSDPSQHQIKPVVAGRCRDRVNDRVPRIISRPAPGHFPDREYAAFGVAHDVQATLQRCRSLAIGGFPLERPSSTGFVESFKQGDLVGGNPLG